MKKIIWAFIITGVLFSFCHAQEWDKAVQQVRESIAQSNADVKTARQNAASEKAELSSKLAASEAEVLQMEEQLESLKKELDALSQEEEALQLALETEQKEVVSLGERLSGIANESPELHNLEGRSFTRMEDIRALADAFFAEIEAGGRIRRETGTFADQKGEPAEGEIISIGPFISLYQKGDAAGYLKKDPQNGLSVLPGDPPWGIRRAVKKYVSGETDHLPIDITGGALLEQLNKQGDATEWITAGGLLVWPILLIGVIALLLSLERLFSLGRIPTHTDRFMDKIRELAQSKDWDACRAFCDNHSKIPVCRMIRSGLAYVGSTREVLENALEEAMLAELPKLERFLSTLSVLAATAPLLGLLGTVTGMIHTFEGITVFGTGDPRMMSGGISEALITTQLGLAVAIPITIIHHFFDRRVEKIIGDMEEKGTALVTALIAD